MLDQKVGQWEDVTKETLMELAYERNLSDRRIAEIYGVTVGKVRYKRNKFGVTLRNKMYEELLLQSGDFYDDLNSKAKNELLKPRNIDGIAKALTHYAFRSGPVEDMHDAGKLTQEDMKILNKFMVNRLAGILSAVHDENWLQLVSLFAFYDTFSINWDSAEPDTKELELAFREYFYSNI